MSIPQEVLLDCGGVDYSKRTNSMAGLGGLGWGWREPWGARVGPENAVITGALHIAAVSSMTIAMSTWKQVGASPKS